MMLQVPCALALSGRGRRAEALRPQERLRHRVDYHPRMHFQYSVGLRARARIEIPPAYNDLDTISAACAGERLAVNPSFVESTS